MANLGSIRATIHSVWETLFPSVVYFALFVLIAYQVADVVVLVPLTAEGVESFKAHPVYTNMKELELHKLLPLALFAVLVFVLYLLDRAAHLIGIVVPPFPIWIGSTALFVDADRLRGFWCMLPDVQNAAALDYEARTIIEGVQMEDKLLPQNSLEYLADSFSRAAAVLAYAKTGVIWTLLMLTLSIFNGAMSPLRLLWALGWCAGFIALGMIGLARETKALIARGEEEIRVAEAILRARGNRPLADHALTRRRELFDAAYENSVRHAKRFVSLKWKPVHDLGTLRKAFFGFR